MKKFIESISHMFKKFRNNSFKLIEKVHASFVTECNEIISVLPYTEISASSHKNSRKRKSCMPDMGDLNSSKGWCPRKQNGKYSSDIFLLFSKNSS